MSRITLVSAGVAVVAVSATLAAWSVSSASPMVEGRTAASTATFRLMKQPESAADRSARAFYTGSIPTDLSNSRLLGTDASGRRYLLASDGADMCLVVLRSRESAGVVCNPASEIVTRTLWTEFGDDQVSYVATAVSDEYSDAKVITTGRVVLHEKNLVLVKTRGKGQDNVTLDGPTYAPLEIKTRG